MRKNNLPLHLVLLNSIILLLTSSGCVRYDIQDDDTKPPDSEKIERVLDEIEKRGFCLDIELYRTGVSTRIQALYDERGRIDIIYDWRINDREVKKEVFYSNNQLFIKETGIWEESVKSERFPHEIVQTVTSFGNFLYLGRRGGSFIYEFTPNLMFLSPVIEETEAKINLDIKTLNPQYIEAKGKDVYFKAIFEGFGDNIRIDHPLSEIYRADISPVPNEIDLSSIKRRLLDTGADDCWIENSSLYIKTFQIDKGILRRVLQKGTLYIFTAKYLRESRDEAKEKYGERVVMLGDLTLILIDSLLYVGSVEDAELGQGARGERISIRLADEMKILEPFLVMIDDRPVSIYPKFMGREMKITGDRVDCAILKSGLLSREYELMDD